MPRFSIIIPTFNRERLIGATLESVFAQPGDDYEVLVVDDGSTDGTLAALEPWRERISVLAQANAGPGPARNLGAARARGEYLAFLDSDDLWFPWTLRVIRSIIDQHRPSLIASMPRAFGNAAELAGEVEPEESEIEHYADYLASDPVNIFPGAGAMVVRREAFAASGGFASRRMGGEDAELFLRLGIAPGFVFVRKPPLVGYRMHTGSYSVDVQAGLTGRWEMIRLERQGRFPGGDARATDRRRVLTSHFRSGMIVALRAGCVLQASSLYRATFGWHVREGRWKFLAAFPLLALGALVRGKPGAQARQGFLIHAPAEGAS